MQETKLRYVMEFVSDMGTAVKFYRDELGLQLKFESPMPAEVVVGDLSLSVISRSHDSLRSRRAEP